VARSLKLLGQQQQQGKQSQQQEQRQEEEPCAPCLNDTLSVTARVDESEDDSSSSTEEGTADYRLSCDSTCTYLSGSVGLKKVEPSLLEDASGNCTRTHSASSVSTNNSAVVAMLLPTKSADSSNHHSSGNGSDDDRQNGGSLWVAAGNRFDASPSKSPLMIDHYLPKRPCEPRRASSSSSSFGTSSWSSSSSFNSNQSSSSSARSRRRDRELHRQQLQQQEVPKWQPKRRYSTPPPLKHMHQGGVLSAPGRLQGMASRRGASLLKVAATASMEEEVGVPEVSLFPPMWAAEVPTTLFGLERKV
jgi:hypothetical protein